MVDLEIAQRWTPRHSNGMLEPLLVVPCRFDAGGNTIEYLCVKEESGATVHIASHVLEAYYERDGIEEEAA